MGRHVPKWLAGIALLCGTPTAMAVEPGELPGLVAWWTGESLSGQLLTATPQANDREKPDHRAESRQRQQLGKQQGRHPEYRE